MRREEFLAKACLSEAWRRLVWRMGIFAVCKFPADEKPEPYDINYIDGIAHYFSPETHQWEIIEDVEKDTEIFYVDDAFAVTPDNYPGLKESKKTTVGRYVYNWIVTQYAFGTRMPYYEGKNPKELEREIFSRCLESDDDNPEDEESIRPAMVGKFVQAINELRPMCGVIAPTGSIRSLYIHPDAEKVLKALLEKYKDDLSAANIKKIEDAMDALDKEWLSGDQSIKFYSSKKSRARRRKLFYFYGIESSFKEGNDFTLIPKSLISSSKMEYLVDKFNNARAGSYSRGAETAKGGEMVRILSMIFMNHRIVKGDCGTKLRVTVLLNEANKKRYIGMTADHNGKLIEVDKAFVEANMGKYIKLRRPFLCQMEHIDCCSACSSELKAEEPEAVFVEITSGMSNVMGAAMSAMHGSDNNVVEFVPKLHIT